ncbi:MAG: phenylalanine 4-monooxygenase [Sphingomonas bacterium]|nr:phenylalanine 4-monooxygenase [Sphingomonas bacterium]
MESAAAGLRPPEGAAADWTVPQRWAHYSAAEHALWDRLFARQARQLRSRASRVWMRGLEALRLSKPGIPDFDELSERLMASTGWQVVAVPGLVPDAVFFDHLANRRFVAGSFLRRPDQIDYLEEPDVFHDVFGHVPMLADPVFADYIQAYGQGGQRSLGFGALAKLARLYWYTVEFGLVEEEGNLKIYGSGIVSSHGESRFALDDPSPHRIGFDLMRVMRTRYRIDDYQQCYFVVPDFATLLDTTLNTDFAPVYAALEGKDEVDPTALLPGDRVIHRGTQARGAISASDAGSSSRQDPAGPPA